VDVVEHPVIAGQRLSVPSNQRREARQRPSQSNPGAVLLRDVRTDCEAPVVALRDYSPSGASVLARLQYPPGHLISLVVFIEGIRMEFFGTVAWCRAASDLELGESNLPPGMVVFLVGLQMRGPVGLADALKPRPRFRIN
jgi:hypothetical protein